MRRMKRVMLIGLSFVLGIGVSANSQDKAPFGEAVFRPVPLANSDAKICAKFEQAWIDVFDGPTELDEQYVDLSAAFPTAKHFTFPPETDSRGNFRGLYDASYAKPVDLDADGDLEILHVEGDTLGWRYMGVSLYEFDSQVSYDNAKLREDHIRHGDKFMVDWGGPLDPAPHKLASYRPGTVVKMMEIDGAIYAQSTIYAAKRGPLISGKAVRVRLDRLLSKDAAEKICEIQLGPEPSQLLEISEKLPTSIALRDYYGGKTGCNMGSMGWRATEPEMHLFHVLYRPQAMIVDDRDLYAKSDSELSDAKRERRIMVWATSDPTSWQVYLDLKNSYDSLIDNLSVYYRTHFGYSEIDAKAMSEKAYRYLVDKVFYARNSQYESYRQFDGNREDYPGPQSSPKTVADFFITEGLSTDGKRGYFSGETIGKLAVYVKTDTETVREIFAQVEEHYARQINDTESDSQKTYLTKRRQNAIDIMFIASLDNPDLMALTQGLGANIDAPTNAFKKTALMYAAQNNEIEGVKFLLAQGANPNAKTEAKDGACNGNLDRNHRTPLMYAAENADVQLIETLLEAGADPGAQDTKNNAVSWYLNRNTHLTDYEKATILTMLETP